jgi:hypothetical protein
MGWLPGSALDALFRLATDGHLRMVSRDPRTGKIEWQLTGAPPTPAAESVPSAPARADGESHQPARPDPTPPVNARAADAGVSRRGIA